MTDYKKHNKYDIKYNPVVINLPLVKVDQIEKWMYNKVRSVKKVLETGVYPECTASETWNGIRCNDWCDVREFCTQRSKKMGA